MPELSTDYAVELKDVFFGYGSTRILSGVNLKVGYGEAVAIMGKSGAGKTTLLKIIAGLLKPERGHVRVLGCITHTDCFNSLRGRIAYIPQNLGLVEGESALYNVLLAKAPSKPLRFMAGLWGRDDLGEAFEALKMVGLDGKARSRVDRLSGGERQRVAIARAILQRAEVLLADEPVSSLDLDTAEDIVRFMAGLKSKGLTIIAVMHDKWLTSKYFDKIYLLDGGVLREAV
ncbi:MAG TPA: ATP-binding cassette domain-containing protein [Sulfolobales archaeon]|nr:ATP-binding cassette domain-containing protein [Sulfolobales archaeon]